MKRVPVEVTAITVCPPYPGYMLILREMEGIRWLPIFIGQPEAQSIAHIQKGGRSVRPFTFDLVHGMLDATGTRIEEVLVTELRDQTFFAEVVLRLSSGGIRQVDARPSDAIAIALRARAPIFISEQVMSEAGQTEGTLFAPVAPPDRLDDLNEQLAKAVNQEAYEEAARIRDAIRELQSQAETGKA